MSERLTLRAAALTDAELLLKWRNDPATRAASHCSVEVAPAEHQAWLARAVRDADRKLFIVEENGIPVGTVRADRDKDAWTLSWTVAPEARGRGLAKRMAELLAAQVCGPIRAEIKRGNAASVRIAEHLGMVLVREARDVLHYRRPSGCVAGGLPTPSMSPPHDKKAEAARNE